MTRVFALLAAAAASGLAGCASTWDTVSSQRFRSHPWDTAFKSDDPVEVLRTSTDGDARARALRKVKEPVADGGTLDQQEFVFRTVAQAATADPSPWVRIAAVDALGRFQDPRAPGALVAAYHQATGSAPPAAAADAPVLQTGNGRTLASDGLLNDRLGLHGPQGYAPDQVATLRGRALDALARTGKPEGVAFLTRVATGQEDRPGDDPMVRTVAHQRAVAGLAQTRQKDAVVALSQVLAAEKGKDLTLTHLAHEGLVSLTGQRLPDDPEKWGRVVQAGFEIAPEPSAVDRAVGIFTP